MSNNNVTENLKDAAETARSTAESVAQEAREQARVIYQKADVARRDVIKQLYDTADQIRADTKDVSGEARDQADKIARNLEQTANKLNNRAVDQLEDVTETAQQHVWRTTFIVFAIGLIVGWLLSRD